MLCYTRRATLVLSEVGVAAAVTGSETMQHTELGTSWYSHGPQKIIPRSINPDCQFHKMKYRLTKLENRYFHYPQALILL